MVNQHIQVNLKYSPVPLKSSLVGLPRSAESSVRSLLDRLKALTPSSIARKHGLECWAKASLGIMGKFRQTFENQE